MKILKRITSTFADTKSLFRDNKEAIKKFNQELIPKVSLIAMATVLIPLIFAFFRDSMIATIPAYILTFVAITVLYFAFQFTRLKEYPRIFIYLLGFAFFGFTLYLSVWRFPDRPAGTILTLFVVAPLIFIDRSHRINIYMLTALVMHVVLAFISKSGDLPIVDLLNASISVILGLLFGRLFLLTRLNALDVERLLNIEMQTDYLTGLLNRRKLYLDLKVAAEQSGKTIGVLMIDIDLFKVYNDNYGHVNGDLSLAKFGEMLLEVKAKYSVSFYRYGGEEFVGITHGLEDKDVRILTEEIRQETAALVIPHERFTVSIGYALTDNHDTQNIDTLLDRADKAMYSAKTSGKNRIQAAK